MQFGTIAIPSTTWASWDVQEVSALAQTYAQANEPCWEVTFISLGTAPYITALSGFLNQVGPSCMVPSVSCWPAMKRSHALKMLVEKASRFWSSSFSAFMRLCWSWIPGFFSSTVLVKAGCGLRLNNILEILEILKINHYFRPWNAGNRLLIFLPESAGRTMKLKGTLKWNNNIQHLHLFFSKVLHELLLN